MRFELVADWKRARKWLSVQIPAAGVVVFASYGALPDDFKTAIPHWLISWTGIGFFAAGIAGRLLAQPVIESEKDAP